MSKVTLSKVTGIVHSITRLYCNTLRSSGLFYPGFEPCQSLHVRMQLWGLKMTQLSCWPPRGQLVNLRNPLLAGDKGHKWEIDPGFETQGRRHQKSKTGISVAPQKGLMPSKIDALQFFLKNDSGFTVKVLACLYCRTLSWWRDWTQVWRSSSRTASPSWTEDSSFTWSRTTANT